MKICILFKIDKGVYGGGNRFIRTLSDEFVRAGHEVVYAFDRSCDLVLLNAYSYSTQRPLDLQLIQKIKDQQRQIPIVHRLDGAAEFIVGQQTEADTLQTAVNKLTDFTIFQTDYSQNILRQHNIHPRNATVIHNGVDGAYFYPAETYQPYDGTLRLVGNSWSTNPSKGFTTLAEISCLPNVEMRFIGRWAPTIDPKNVILLGSQDPWNIGDILRQTDAMVHAGQDEACSNAIVEALACGLPILYHDSGGNGELVRNYGYALTNDLANDIERMRQQYPLLRDRILADRNIFLISVIAQKYLAAFDQAIHLMN